MSHTPLYYTIERFRPSIYGPPYAYCKETISVYVTGHACPWQTSNIFITSSLSEFLTIFVGVLDELDTLPDTILEIHEFRRFLKRIYKQK